MNAANPYLKQYKKNQIETATPEQILILLYDGAIQYLNKAKISLEQNDEEQFRVSLLDCEKIILEFMNSLDMELGGSIAENLYSLYDYLYSTLVMAAITHNVDKVDEVLKHLKNLRETWLKAIDIANAEKEAKLIDKTGDKYDKKDYVDRNEVNYKYDDDDEDDDYDDDDDDEDDDEIDEAV